MSIQKKRRKHEVEEANEHANSPGDDIDSWLLAQFLDACLVAQLGEAAIESQVYSVGHRKYIQRTVNHDFDPDGEYEEHEGVVVLDTNTVINPRTVMVESFNTLIANRAVARSCSLDDFTLRTEVCRVDVSQELKERCRFLRHNGTWIFTRSIEECQEYDHRRDCARKQYSWTVFGQLGLDDEQTEQIDDEEQSNEEGLSFVISFQGCQWDSQQQALTVRLLAEMLV